MEAEFSLIASAYERSRSNVAGLIRRSDVLYLDVNKKRTDTWLMSIGLQLPSDQPVYDSIGSISYSGTDVNIEGVPFDKVFEGQAQGNTDNSDTRYSLDDTPPWEQARQQWDEERTEGYDTTAPDYIDNVSDKAIQAAMKRAGVKTLEEYSNWLEAQNDNTAQIKEIENDLRTATEQQFAAKPSLNQRMIESYEKTGQGVKLKQGGMESDQPGRYVGLSEENEDLLEGLHRDMRQLGIENFDDYLEYQARQVTDDFMQPKSRRSRSTSLNVG